MNFHPPSITASPHVGTQAASVVNIESSKILPLMIFLAILCGLSIGLSVFSFSASRESERETRMLEYYLLELDAKFINAGLKSPAESIAKKLNKEVEK